MCKYCEGEEEEISSRTEFAKKSDCGYAGFEVYVIPEESVLHIACAPDTHEIVFEEKDVKINYCPMCGRKLR